MAEAFIGIGSNLGNKRGNCMNALDALDAKAEISLLKASSLYYTEPYGDIKQDWFVNSVAKVETELNPFDLLQLLKTIESEFGRARNIKGGPRTLDLDMLFYDNLVLSQDRLTIPHPLSHERAFVLIPLMEIASHFIHPVLKVSAMELLNDLNDGKIVQPLQNQQELISHCL
ncbi:MAG: 2-amino-4-hydroxy-6-hydroxymethyldihydropteridine diphosphokinase [Thermodesulfobacteriota bacterium]